jgi:hypothetical protein
MDLDTAIDQVHRRVPITPLLAVELENRISALAKIDATNYITLDRIIEQHKLRIRHR